MPDTAFQPTTMRGRELLRHVFSIIEAEHEKDVEWGNNDEGKWDQGSWGHVETEGLRDAGVDFGALLGDQVRPDGTRLTIAEIALDAGTVKTACGTACCFAGHTSLAVGDKVLFSMPVDLVDEQYDRSISFESVIPVESINPNSPARVGSVSVSVMGRARDLLGLDFEEADMLFDSDNDIEDIRQMVDYLAEGRSISTCDACGERPWDCDFEAETCDACERHLEDCDCCATCEMSEDQCDCNTCPRCGTYSEDDEVCDDCSDDGE